MNLWNNRFLLDKLWSDKSNLYKKWNEFICFYPVSLQPISSIGLLIFEYLHYTVRNN